MHLLVPSPHGLTLHSTHKNAQNRMATFISKASQKYPSPHLEYLFLFYFFYIWALYYISSSFLLFVYRRVSLHTNFCCGNDVALLLLRHNKTSIFHLVVETFVLEWYSSFRAAAGVKRLCDKLEKIIKGKNVFKIVQNLVQI